MDTEWDEYLQSLSNKYGKITNLIWISKKRRKYVLEFAYTRMLVINDEVYKFKDIVSCKIEKACIFAKGNRKSLRALYLAYRNEQPNQYALSVTVWSKSVASEINDLIQEIVKSNKILQ